MKQKLKENKCSCCGEYGLCTSERDMMNRTSLYYRCVKCNEYFDVLRKKKEEAKEKKRLSFIEERDRLLRLNNYKEVI